MALQFPLSKAQFLDILPVRSISFKPSANSVTSRTNGGDVIKHRLGARLWAGEITLGRMRHQRAAEIEALLALMEEPGGAFMLSDLRKPYPASDPGGVILAGSTPAIHALNVNNRELSLNGLPAGYEVTPGDYIGFSYGSSPQRHALHRVVTGGVASGAGVASQLEVIPFIRPGALVGTGVELINSACKAKIIEADYGNGRAVISEGSRFTWLQTLR